MKTEHEMIGIIKHLNNNDIGKICSKCGAKHACNENIVFNFDEKEKIANTMCECGAMWSIKINMYESQEWFKLSKDKMKYISQNKVMLQHETIGILCKGCGKPSFLPFYKLKESNYFTVCAKCNKFYSISITDIADLGSRGRPFQDYTLNGEGITHSERFDRIKDEFNRFIEEMR